MTSFKNSKNINVSKHLTGTVYLHVFINVNVNKCGQFKPAHDYIQFSLVPLHSYQLTQALALFSARMCVLYSVSHIFHVSVLNTTSITYTVASIMGLCHNCPPVTVNSLRDLCYMQIDGLKANTHGLQVTKLQFEWA